MPKCCGRSKAGSFALVRTCFLKGRSAVAVGSRGSSRVLGTKCVCVPQISISNFQACGGPNTLSIVRQDLGGWLVAGHTAAGPLTRAAVLSVTLGKSPHLPRPPSPGTVTSTRMGHWEDEWPCVCICQCLVNQMATYTYLRNGSYGLKVCGVDSGPSRFHGQNVMAPVYTAFSCR